VRSFGRRRTRDCRSARVWKCSTKRTKFNSPHDVAADVGAGGRIEPTLLGHEKQQAGTSIVLLAATASCRVRSRTRAARGLYRRLVELVSCRLAVPAGQAVSGKMLQVLWRRKGKKAFQGAGRRHDFSAMTGTGAVAALGREAGNSTTRQ